MLTGTVSVMCPVGPVRNNEFRKSGWRSVRDEHEVAERNVADVDRSASDQRRVEQPDVEVAGVQDRARRAG